MYRNHVTRTTEGTTYMNVRINQLPSTVDTYEGRYHVEGLESLGEDAGGPHTRNAQDTQLYHVSNEKVFTFYPTVKIQQMLIKIHTKSNANRSLYLIQVYIKYLRKGTGTSTSPFLFRHFCRHFCFEKFFKAAAAAVV